MKRKAKIYGYNFQPSLYWEDLVELVADIQAAYSTEEDNPGKFFTNGYCINTTVERGYFTWVRIKSITLPNWDLVDCDYEFTKRSFEYLKDTYGLTIACDIVLIHLAFGLQHPNQIKSTQVVLNTRMSRKVERFFGVEFYPEGEPEYYYAEEFLKECMPRKPVHHGTSEFKEDNQYLTASHQEQDDLMQSIRDIAIASMSPDYGNDTN